MLKRLRVGLGQASFQQRRQLVELLIDRVVVTDDQVEIRYVIQPPRQHQTRFCHLRPDYFAVECREGWWYRPHSGEHSASQRGQVVTSTANTSGSASGTQPTSRSRRRSVSIRPRGERDIGAAPAAPAGRLQAQVRQRRDRGGAQQRVAQLE